jgi:hypothetical protein
MNNPAAASTSRPIAAGHSGFRVARLVADAGSGSSAVERPHR